MSVADQNELMLLERVFLRLGSADTDEQLQSTLTKLLCPVLLKVESKADGVQTKVMELLVHINKRVKSRPKVLLPINDLLVQYADPDISAFVKNFTIIYIKTGYPRLEIEKQLELVPVLLKNYNGRPQPQQTSILQLIMPVFQYMKPTKGSKLKADILGLKELPHLEQTMLQYTMDILLLPYNYSSYKSPSQSAHNIATTGTAAESTPFNGPPPGMSQTAKISVLGDFSPAPDDLEKVKLGVIEVLSGDTFKEQDILCHLLIGTADTRHSVSSAADREMKKIIGNQDWNNPTIIAKLYSIFQGTVLVKGKNIKSEDKRTPANVQMRLKLFPYFLKSRESCNQFPACIQIVFDCLYGANTNARIKNMAVQFVHHLCLYCPDNKMKPVAQVLLNGMTKLIAESTDDAKLRSLAYVAVGKISRRVPHIVGKDVGLLQTFFDALCKEESENRLAVQEALSLLSEAFGHVDDSGQRQVEALIMQNIDKDESHARLVAVQYAHAVFPPDHVSSRFALLLACGDKKEEVHSEAKKLLRAPLKAEIERKLKTGPSEPEAKKVKSRLLPTFTDMVSYIKLKGSQRIKTQNRYVSGNHTLAFNPATYQEILVYLRLCLCYDAKIELDLESLENMQQQSPKLAKYVAELLDKDSNSVESGPVAEYINMIRKLLTAVPNETSMYCLLELVAVVRQKLAVHFTKHKDWIKSMMFSTRENMRVYAAELYALVTVYGETTNTQTEVIQNLTQNISTQVFEGQHGSLLCLGHLIGYLRSHDSMQIEDMETNQSLEQSEQLKDILKEALKKIVVYIENNQLLLALAACSALGEIGRKCQLPLDAETTKSVVDKLIDIVNTDKQNIKLRERASVTLGYLCLGQAAFPYTQEIIEGLLKCAGPKQFELHMTVGEALVCAGLGPASPAARDVWLVSEEQFKAPADCDTSNVEKLLELLLSKYVTNPSPYVKQAACVWLLAVTKHCGKLGVVQKQLLQVQSAFMSLLSENDEMTQDIASKGLGVVYENCTAEQKQELVSTLVETLTTGKKAETKVTGDTKVFEAGSMGKTPDGKNLTTYRELCSIANDLNQPDLIYKFMHLANHNAIWNSKKGAAYGFSTIAAQAGEQLAPYLHKIVPKMFRYQFDPNPKIQQAMASIWNALVPETKKTVDKYMKEILSDLLKNLTNTQWRVRESSCIALTDLLRGRPLDDVIEYLPELWDTCFRVRDDIKESVRNAADTACKALSKACIKICNPTYGKVGVHATSLVLPCLLKTGLDSQVQEVRAISLATLLKISKNAGELLKPHISLLVYVLLESLSTLEPQYINYVSLHVASSADTTEKLDNARVAASKTSPMMEVVNYCIPFIDESVLRDLVPRLTELLRSAIGLGTKAGVANFIVSLAHQCPKLLAPHAGKLLSALLNGLNDRNTTVKKTFGSTIGHLVKVAKDSSVEKLIIRLKDWYFEKEDESMKLACGTTLQSIAQRSPDVLKRHGAIVLPLAFLAMHQKPKGEGEKDKSNNVWEDVWLETTPGTEAGIKLYLKELVEISQFALESQSWDTKAQGAAAMQTIANKLGGNLGPPHLALVLKALMAGLSGRTWTGKESLLKAVSSVCVSCRDAVMANEDPDLNSIIQAMLRECRKETILYKIEAIRCTGDILEAHEALDRFEEISIILSPILQKKDEKDKDIDRNTKVILEEVAFRSLGQAWPTNKNTQVRFHSDFINLLNSAMGNSVWRVEETVLKMYSKYLSRVFYLQNAEEMTTNLEQSKTVINELVMLLVKSLGNIKYSVIRSEALSVLDVLFAKLKECNTIYLLQSGQLHDTLHEALKTMSTSDSQPELAHRAVQLDKLLIDNTQGS